MLCFCYHMSRCIYPYNFSPLSYINAHDAAGFVSLFESQGVPLVVPLHAWRRRNAWATTLPLGVFHNDFRPGVVTLEAHMEVCNTIYRQNTEAALEQNLPRHPHDPALAAQIVEGQVFYHVEALRFLRTQVPDTTFLEALYAFLLAATHDRALIVPPTLRTPYVPPEARKRVHQLKHVDMCRGPSWTPAEDAVLRRWFGMHTSGPHQGLHAPLSEAGWKQVLEVELAGRRSRASCQARFVRLNELLLREFEVDGYVPITRIKAYMQRAIGVRPRVPPTRPTQKRRQSRPSLNLQAQPSQPSLPLQPSPAL
jgi:hypothetical protein